MKPSFVNLTRHSDDSISTIIHTSETVNCSRLLTPNLRCLHRSVPQTSLQRVSSFNIPGTPAIKMTTYLTAYLPLMPSSYLQHVPCQTAMLLTCSSSVLTSCHRTCLCVCQLDFTHPAEPDPVAPGSPANHIRWSHSPARSVIHILGRILSSMKCLIAFRSMLPPDSYVKYMFFHGTMPLRSYRFFFQMCWLTYFGSSIMPQYSQ